MCFPETFKHAKGEATTGLLQPANLRETWLQSNAVFNWLCANLEAPLNYNNISSSHLFSPFQMPVAGCTILVAAAMGHDISAYQRPWPSLVAKMRVVIREVTWFMSIVSESNYFFKTFWNAKSAKTVSLAFNFTRFCYACMDFRCVIYKLLVILSF